MTELMIESACQFEDFITKMRIFRENDEQSGINGVNNVYNDESTI